MRFNFPASSLSLTPTLSKATATQDDKNTDNKERGGKKRKRN